MARAKGQLQAGDHVRLCSLAARCELNGEVGRALEFFEDRGRWAIALNGVSNNPMLLKPANLEKLSTAELLRERGYAVLKLGRQENKLVVEACAAAKTALSASDAEVYCLMWRELGIDVRTVVPATGAKTILSLAHSPLHALKEQLQRTADAALDEVCSMLELQPRHLRQLVGKHEESTLSALRYDGLGGCDEHEE